MEHAAPRVVVGIDRSKGLVAHARARVTDARIAFQVGDAQALAVADDAFDAVVSGLVLNFVPEPGKMVAEMARAGRPGSAIALYVWDYAAGMELMSCFWNAARALEPAAAALEEAVRFPDCAPAPLEALFTAAGLSGVATRAIDVHTRFRDFDDYWSPFLGGQGPAPAYAMSLPEGRRVALREAIRASLPIASDGSIPLTASAWAVRGFKPHITAPRRRCAEPPSPRRGWRSASAGRVTACRRATQGMRSASRTQGPQKHWGKYRRDSGDLAQSSHSVAG